MVDVVSRIKMLFIFGCISIGFSFYVLEYHMLSVRRFLQLFNILQIGFIDNYLAQYQLLNFSSNMATDFHITSIFGSINAFFESPLIGQGFAVAKNNIDEDTHLRYEDIS